MGAVPHAWLIVPLVKASRVIVASYASIMWHQLHNPTKPPQYWPACSAWVTVHLGTYE